MGQNQIQKDERKNSPSIISKRCLFKVHLVQSAVDRMDVLSKLAMKLFWFLNLKGPLKLATT